MSFAKLGLADALIENIEYPNPSPVQKLAIPKILDGKDIIAGAQTGTGKTAAFSLPIIDQLIKLGPAKHSHPRALVLTPTRELALQVHEKITG